MNPRTLPAARHPVSSIPRETACLPGGVEGRKCIGCGLTVYRKRSIYCSPICQKVVIEHARCIRERLAKLKRERTALDARILFWETDISNLEAAGYSFRTRRRRAELRPSMSKDEQEFEEFWKWAEARGQIYASKASAKDIWLAARQSKSAEAKEEQTSIVQGNGPQSGNEAQCAPSSAKSAPDDFDMIELSALTIAVNALKNGTSGAVLNIDGYPFDFEPLLKKLDSKIKKVKP